MTKLERPSFREKKANFFVCPKCGEKLVRARSNGEHVVYRCENESCKVISVHFRYGSLRRSGPVGIRRIKEAAIIG